MSRELIPFTLSDADRYRIGEAREALADAGHVDVGDDVALARTVGRLEVVLKHLLDVFDEHEAGDGP